MQCLRFRLGLLVLPIALFIGASILLFSTADAHLPANTPTVFSNGSSERAPQQGTPTSTPTAPATTQCWEVIPEANPGSTASLSDVEIITSDDAWAVGDYYDGSAGDSTALTEHWDGTKWTFVPSPDAGFYSTLESVTAISTNDVWAVGIFKSDSSSPIQSLAMHWDGSQWSIFPVPGAPSSTESYLLGVAAVASGDVWAVGYYRSPDIGTHPLIAHWNGTAWSLVSAPTPGGTNGFHFLRSIAATSSGDVWAVGEYSASTGPSRTLILRWDGQAWNVVTSPNIASVSNSLKSVAIVSANDVWSVGSFGVGSPTTAQTLAMHWDGAAWSIVSTPSFGLSNDLFGVGAVSSDDVWAVGDYFDTNTGYQQAMTLHWDGAAWSVGYNPRLGGDQDLSGMDATEAGDVWAVGRHYTMGTSRPLIERYAGFCAPPTATPYPTPTAPPPATPTPIPSCPPGWEAVFHPNGIDFYGLRDVAVISENDVWAVGTSNRARLILHWDGTRWSVVPSPDPDPSYDYLTGVTAMAPTDVWAVGYYGDSYDYPYRTLTMHWDGLTWAIVPSPNIGSVNNQLYDVDVVAPDDVWAVGLCCNGPTMEMLAIHWDGSQWSVIPIPTIVPGGGPIVAVDAISANDVWALANGGGSLIHWDGSTWGYVDIPRGGIFGNDLVDISAISANDIWTVGYYSRRDPNSHLYSQTLIEHWDGIEWRVVPSPNVGTYNNNYLYGVAAVSWNDVWAVGYSTLDEIGQTRTLIMHWDGSEWNVIPGSNPGTEDNQLFAVSALPANRVWAVGNYSHTGSIQSTFTLIEQYKEQCPCTLQFSDVDESNPFYTYVRCLACRNIVSGYDCGGPGEPCPGSYFRPGADVTRGQLSKIIANAAALNDPIPPDRQTFEDVPSGNPFWLWIERLSDKGAISGYLCGSEGEPCVPPGNRPYFRPGNNATRSQIAKIVSNAADIQDYVPDTQQTFEDVPPTYTFWLWVERLSERGILGGYPCGGEGEPCVPPDNRPYFRPGNNTTRGQMSKIGAKTFFPGCQTPGSYSP
jgi:hypothetical protein